MDDNIWAEELPEKCPPADAYKPNNEPFYRLVKRMPPEERDFWSNKKLYPNKKYYLAECIARACSIISTLDQCMKLTKLPTQRDKFIVKIALPPQAGLIKRTGKNQDHYSWWRTKDFDPISICVEVKQ